MPGRAYVVPRDWPFGYGPVTSSWQFLVPVDVPSAGAARYDSVVGQPAEEKEAVGIIARKEA